MLKVSIIVPVHNSKRTLAQCVDSIISQSYGNVECILVENGSSDGSKELCDTLASKYKNVVYKSSQILGVSNARNEGLALATGNIVGFCDADDFLEPEALKSVMNVFLSKPSVVSVFAGFYIGKRVNGKVEKKYIGLKNQQQSIHNALRLVISNDSIMGSVWNKYYRYEFVKNVRFKLDLSYCEDMHFNTMVLNAIDPKKKVEILSHPIYCYMDNPQSLTHDQRFLFDKDDELKYIIAMKKIMQDCVLDKRTLSLVKMKVACFCIDAIGYIDLDIKKKNILKKHLQQNYIYLLVNLFVNNWKWNIKRAYFGIKILFDNKLGR